MRKAIAHVLDELEAQRTARLGGLMVADNITRPQPDAGILEYVRKAREHAEARSQLIELGSGLELTIRLAAAGGEG